MLNSSRLAYSLTLVWLAAFPLCGCGSAQSGEQNDAPAAQPDDTSALAGGTGGAATVGDPAASSISHCAVDETLADSDAGALFDYAHVPVFDLYLPEDKWQNLIAHAVDEQWERAEACFEGKQVGTVGLRFKGSYGTLYGCFDDAGQLQCPRLSMKLKFSKYESEQRFFGLKRLNFHANRHDDSRMREKLAYDLYREMGVTAPRAAWAVVRVNGQSYGLYGMVEELDGRFTEDRWPGHPDGNLYKELWPTDSDETDIRDALRTNEDDGDISGFTTFASALAQAQTDGEVLAALDEHTDLGHWAAYMAVDEAILSYDGVTYFYTDDGNWSHNHNYYFYEDAPGHFTLIPWDVESSFWINPDHAPPHWTEAPADCTTTYPYWDGFATAPGCDPVFQALASDPGAWRAAIRELLDGPFAEARMLATIDAHEAFIGEEARAAETPTMYTSFDSAVAQQRNVIGQLRARLEAWVAE